MKWLKRIGLLMIVGILTFLLGPRQKAPTVNTILPVATANLIALEREINEGEKTVANIKPDNEARIIWANPEQKSKTEYSVVYVHGWSASQGEGDPIHREFAERYGCNLFLSRLHGHGLKGDKGMSEISVEKLLESAKEAIAIGKSLGEKVILMSCSTGSTLAIYLASGNPDIHALINYSPNIDLYDSNSFLLTWPWGLQMAHLVTGSEYHSFKADPNKQKYWTTKYRFKAIVALKSLINTTMQESTFRNIQQPFFMCYYYKDETHQDQVVSVPRMQEMFDQLGTPDQQKRKVALPNVKAHGLCSKYFSKDLDSVRKTTYDFVEEVLKMKPVPAPEVNVLEAVLQ